jgi:D-psicose/D-tagatose/L-ribulose 3-epimerase
MKIGMNLLLWTAHVTEKDYPLLERLKSAGYDGVEIPIFEGDEKHYRAVGKELDRLKLARTSVTVASPEHNPISPDVAVRKKADERLKWVIDMTAAAGGEVVCGPYHSPLGVFTGVGPTADEKKRAVEVLRAGAEHAAKNKIKISTEYLNRFESYFLTTAADAAELVKRVDHPAFGMMYDSFHANIEEKDPIGVIGTCAKCINHVHISENDRGTPGSGNVPWKETFNALKKIKYDNWMVIEAFGRALPELAAATRVWRDFFPSDKDVYENGIKFVKKMWSEAGNA